MKNQKITVIGGGNMGGALIEGFLDSGNVQKSDIVLGTPDEAGQKRFRAMGLTVYADNREAVQGADIVIIAVKPWLVPQVAGQINNHMKNNTLIISVAAGVPLDVLRNYFGESSVCFRVIPNIAASLRSSMTFVSCETEGEAYAPIVVELLRSVGEAVLIPENLLDAAMVSASCGLAYAIRYVRASMEAGIEMGLSADLSRTVVAQTVKGAAELLLQGEQHPEVWIDRVTTPGGVTIVGLNAMEHSGFTSAVIEGHLAAYHHVKK